MCCENVKLVEPTLELKEEFLAMAREHLRVDANLQVWDFEEALADFDAYVKKLLDYARGENLPQGWVPASNYWLITGDHTVLGSSSLRHRLTDSLRKYGGHIGYYIRPSQRRKGYGNVILELTIEKAECLGLKKVLVTCDEDNVASARIIEKHGGVFKDKIMNEGHEVPTRRYWIKIQ
jgi:predicted acetyltransferase